MLLLTRSIWSSIEKEIGVECTQCRIIYLSVCLRELCIMKGIDFKTQFARDVIEKYTHAKVIGISGIDGSGKTTFINELKKHDPTLRIRHALWFTRKIQDKSKAWVQKLIKLDKILVYIYIFLYRKLSRKRLVLDRCVLDSLVYEEYFDGQNKMSLTSRIGMKLAYPDLLILCSRDPEDCFNVIKNRKKDAYLSLGDLKKLSILYKDTFFWVFYVHTRNDECRRTLVLDW